MVAIGSGSTILPVRGVQWIATARRREAERKAERLLRRVVLPSGAVRVRHLPGGSGELLRGSRLGVSVLTKFADRHASWSVRSPLLGGDRDGSVEGKDVIRVDAGAAWVYPRAPREVVPAGVHEIDVAGRGVTRRVTAPWRVALIGRWFDALNIVKPGNAVSAAGSELARAIVPSQPADGCNPIGFSIGGHSQTPLIDSTPGRGNAFIERVQRLLRVHFRSPR